MANPQEQNLASLIISIIILIIVIILIIIVCCGYNNGNNGNNGNQPLHLGLAAAAAYQYGRINKNNFGLANNDGGIDAAGMGGTCVGVKNIGHNCFTNVYSQPGHCIAGSICVPNA